MRDGLEGCGGGVDGRTICRTVFHRATDGDVCAVSPAAAARSSLLGRQRGFRLAGRLESLKGLLSEPNGESTRSVFVHGAPSSLSSSFSGERVVNLLWPRLGPAPASRWTIRTACGGSTRSL